ncbi:MAG TPA: acetate--CoA ligase family protein [Microthrixaceae bacterium]|nr:acetate--CoA ligase family protein [Microthrixaceae bacterium]
MSSPPSSPPTNATRTSTLSEADSKSFLSEFGVPFADERLVTNAANAATGAEAIGFPVVAKLCGDEIAHKTERGLVRLNLGDSAAVLAAAQALLDAATPADRATGVLIAPMLSGSRELIAGIATDAQFGQTVLLGLGGVLAEAIADVSVRLVPITRIDAEEMIEDLRSQALLGEFRGEPALDRASVVDVLVGLSDAATSHPELVSADLNPLIIHEGRAVAVDALVELAADEEVPS